MTWIAEGAKLARDLMVGDLYLGREIAHFIGGSSNVVQFKTKGSGARRALHVNDVVFKAWDKDTGMETWLPDYTKWAENRHDLLGSRHTRTGTLRAVGVWYDRINELLERGEARY